MHLHTRREFLPLLCSLAAPSKAQPFRYDLAIKGGRVIDPSQALSAPLDVAISGDKVARVEANIPEDQRRVLGRPVLRSLQIEPQPHDTVDRLAPIAKRNGMIILGPPGPPPGR